MHRRSRRSRRCGRVLRRSSLRAKSALPQSRCLQDAREVAGAGGCNRRLDGTPLNRLGRRKRHSRAACRRAAPGIPVRQPGRYTCGGRPRGRMFQGHQQLGKRMEIRVVVAVQGSRRQSRRSSRQRPTSPRKARRLVRRGGRKRGSATGQRRVVRRLAGGRPRLAAQCIEELREAGRIRSARKAGPGQVRLRGSGGRRGRNVGGGTVHCSLTRGEVFWEVPRVSQADRSSHAGGGGGGGCGCGCGQGLKQPGKTRRIHLGHNIPLGRNHLWSRRGY